MAKPRFDIMERKLKEDYELDIVKDVILSFRNQIILFWDTKNHGLNLERIHGSLDVINLEPAQTLNLEALFEAFDYDNAYAKVTGEKEYYDAIKKEMLDLKTETDVTFPINTKNGKCWIRFHTVDIQSHKHLKAVFIINASDVIEEEEALFYKTHHDSLTGLFNKYALDHHYGLRYTFDDFHVLFMDLDDFKAFNDEISHPMGNRFLKDFADILSHYESNYNHFYRLGGDEFVGLFFEDTKTVLEIAEAILKDTRKLSSHYGQMRTSASIGIVKADARDDVIRKADQLLYEAKENGKDQYVFEEERNISLEK